MSVSKVIYNNNTLIDLTPSTAIADDVAEGKKFYLANGNSAIGTSQGGGGGEDHEISVESEIDVAKSVSTLPYDFSLGCAVVYNDEIHLLGGTSTSTSHYKWSGSTWTRLSTLPYHLQGRYNAVVYNDEIHILGGMGGPTNHYKWDGISWTSVSTLPYEFSNGNAVVYNNEIHILGCFNSDNRTSHYKWDGISWTSVSTLPYEFYSGCAVVYNDEIHILGGGVSGTSQNHYKWNGTSWVSVPTLPHNLTNNHSVVFKHKIHILYRDESHYEWDGLNWNELSNLPYAFYNGASVVYKEKIHVMGGVPDGYSSGYTKHYVLKIDPTTTPTLNITSNGIYNLIGSKTEQSLNKLVTDLTGEVSCGINVEIDTSGTATADKIASGYTAWVNGEKLTGTMATGGTVYEASAIPSSTSSVTFSNLEIPYASINHYIMTYIGFGSSYASMIIDGQAYRTFYSTSVIYIEKLSGLSVSGSGNSITFTKSRGFTKTTGYTLYYC